MILICQLFHNYHLNLLLFRFFCFDSLFHLHIHLHFNFHNHNHHLQFHFLFHFLLFYFLLSHFHFIFIFVFLTSWFWCFVSKIIFNKSLNKFNNSLCLVVRLLCFIISAFFILFNVFRFFSTSISPIVLFLILLTKSLLSIYLNSPILFL